MNKSENKKLLFLTRIILFVFGFLIGFSVMWQTLDTNNFVKSIWLKIVFYLVVGLLPGTTLALSAKPVYWILATLGAKIRTRFELIKPNDIAAVILGAMAGMAMGFGAEMLFRLFLNIIALRLFLVVVISIATAYVVVVACFQWLKGVDSDKKESKSSAAPPKMPDGYIISASALSDDKIVTLCKSWLSGTKFVVEGIQGLLKNDALENYNSMLQQGIISSLGCEGEDRAKAEEGLAMKMNLKIIVLSQSDADGYSQAASLLILQDIK